MSRVESRWTYTAGSRPEGVAVYDGDTKLHSHHDTDPARGQHSSFDLVRIHRFGELDKDCATDIKMKDRPSYKAMIEFAKKELQRPEDELVEPANDDSWLDIGVPTEPKRRRFQPYSAREFMALPPTEWIVPGVLPQAELAIVLGKPGAGKTFFSMDMACAIERGADWCGRKVRKGRVVYVVLEGTRGFAGRLKAYTEANGVDPDQLPTIIADAPNLIEPKDAEALAQEIGKADVVFIDTLSCAHAGDENAGVDMGRVLRSVKELHKRTGAVIVFLHHPPHEGDRARGWSGLTGAADAIISITKQGDGATAIRSAATSKLKDGVEGPLFNFRITEKGLFEPVGGMVATKAARLPQPGTKQRAALDTIKALIVQSGRVTLADAREAIIATKSEPEPGKIDRRGSRATDEIDALIRHGLLFRIDGKLSDTQLVKGGSPEDF